MRWELSRFSGGAVAPDCFGGRTSVKPEAGRVTAMIFAAPRTSFVIDGRAAVRSKTVHLSIGRQLEKPVQLAKFELIVTLLV